MIIMALVGFLAAVLAVVVLVVRAALGRRNAIAWWLYTGAMLLACGSFLATQLHIDVISKLSSGG